MAGKRRMRPLQVLPGRDRRRAAALGLDAQFRASDAGPEILIPLHKRDMTHVGKLKLLDRIQTIAASDASDFWS